MNNSNQCIYCDFKEVSGGFIAIATVSVCGEVRATIPHYVSSSATASEINAAIDAAIASAMKYAEIPVSPVEQTPALNTSGNDEQTCGEEYTVLQSAENQEAAADIEHPVAAPKVEDSHTHVEPSSSDSEGEQLNAVNGDNGDLGPSEDRSGNGNEGRKANSSDEQPNHNIGEAVSDIDAEAPVEEPSVDPKRPDENQELTLAQARKVIFVLREGAKVAPSSWLAEYVGKTLGELADRRPATISMMVGKASESTLPNDTCLAAMRVIAASFKK